MKTQILKSIFLFCILHFTFCISSNAQIVYTDVNPDQTFSANNSVYHLDMNNDGTADYDITILTGFLGVHPYANIRIIPSAGNNVSMTSSYPSAFQYGALISSANTWATTTNSFIMARDGWNMNPHTGQLIHVTLGNWLNVTDKYLGLKFISGGNTYYGWARLNAHVYSNGTANFTIKDYAYNSIPNQSILAGETSCTMPTVTLSASGPLSFCAGDSVSLTVNGTGYQYQWKKNNVNISGATKQNYVAKTAGTYKCQVTNSCGSIISRAKTVTVPCRNSNETFSETLEHISVYPNPATNSVTIKFPSEEAGEIQIVNLFGQIVYSEKINQEQTQIDVSKFSEGMYVVRYSSGKTFAKEKLILTK